MELSIVIPAYNESRKIARDVIAATSFLSDHAIQGEVIIADDGSNDGTPEVAERTPPAGGVPVVVLHLPHAGKGAAVRGGIVHTRGQYVMFADSGVCVPFVDALQGLQMLKDDRCDIANGSRRLPRSVIARPQNFYRRTLSRLFRSMTLRYMCLPGHLTDTQCGFKMYKGHIARDLYADCRTAGFMFDMEVLMRAIDRGCRIAEFPVHWTWDTDSRLKPMRIVKNVLLDLRRIKHMVQDDLAQVRPSPDHRT